MSASKTNKPCDEGSDLRMRSTHLYLARLAIIGSIQHKELRAAMPRFPLPKPPKTSPTQMHHSEQQRRYRRALDSPGSFPQCVDAAPEE